MLQGGRWEKWRGLRRTMKMIKGLEIVPCHERLNSMGVYF